MPTRTTPSADTLNVDHYRGRVWLTRPRPGVDRNLEWLQAQAPTDRLRFVRGDVRDADLVRSIIGASDVHLVCHFAQHRLKLIEKMPERR